MDFLNTTLSEFQIYEFNILVENWMYIASGGVLALEILKRLLNKSVSWNFIGDGIANFITFAAIIGLYYVVLGSVYITIYYSTSYYMSIVSIPTTIWSVALCIVLADLAYYFEHRFTHRTGIGWATHTVHHSSPYFNLSVAYRFGPLDGVFPIFFHLPLVIIGFNPALVLVAEALVLAYQTLLHTELIGKLPKFIEAIFNTPSHHRVHHGRNPQYIDKNYGGIFIVWDRLFGTFEEEKEKVDYGITNPINSVNPFVVLFHGLTRLSKRLSSATSVSEFFSYLIRPPSWTPENSEKLSSPVQQSDA